MYCEDPCNSRHSASESQMKVISNLSSSKRLAQQLRTTALGLITIYLTILVASLVPLQIANPLWYLRVNSGIVNNGPILVIALVVLSIAKRYANDITHSRSRFLHPECVGRVSRLFFIAVVVSQLVASCFLVNGTIANDRYQTRSIVSRSKMIKEDLRKISSYSSLVEIAALRWSIVLPPKSQGASNIEDLKQEVLTSLDRGERALKRNKSKQTQQVYLKLFIDFVRVTGIGIVLSRICNEFQTT